MELISAPRKGSWMQTFTGKQFWPLDPRPEEIDIRDIARSLSMLCRYNGHCRVFYCVAQHSVFVSRACDPQDALCGLLHDATEAYVGDVIRPLKRHLPGYAEIESRVWDAVATAFKLPLKMPPSVHRADEAVLATEIRDIMLTPPAEIVLTEKPLPYVIVPCSPKVAEQKFLARFRALTNYAL